MGREDDRLIRRLYLPRRQVHINGVLPLPLPSLLPLPGTRPSKKGKKKAAKRCRSISKGR